MIYVLLAEGFEETEAIEPVDVMRRAGLAVMLVGQNDMYVTGAHGITIKTDLLLDEVIKADMELLMLPGGGGYALLDGDERVHGLIDYAWENDLYISAICAAPAILGKKGLLKGKKATCFPGFEKDLEGAEFIDVPVVTDGKITTAYGAGAAFDFGFRLLGELTGDKEGADALKKSMKYSK